MKNVTIYHNARCSKSREALALLQQAGAHITVVDYIKNPLSFEQLYALSRHVLFEDFVRKNEKAFKLSGLSMDNQEAVLRAMAKEPKLMQRPIVVSENGDVVIGRPPEHVLALLK